MAMLCPNCMGEMVSVDGKRAKCSLDGRWYNILCSRYQVSPRLTQSESQSSTTELVVKATSHGTSDDLSISCPHCNQQYTIKTDLLGKKVKCKKCNSNFTIADSGGGKIERLISQEALNAVVCSRHTGVSAAYHCSKCGAGICQTCDFPQSDGTHLCPDCMTNHKENIPPSISDSKPDIPAGTKCALHPTVQAVQICKVCGTAMCNTCDFEYPGNIHVCPSCASKSDQPLSGKRKTHLMWSYVFAVLSTLALIVTLLIGSQAETAEQTMALGIVMNLFVLIPAIIGTALGCSVRDRRLSNPASIMIATIWNGIILGIYILLCIVGALMG
jgi:predicted Zn finger-like uncharacterized protein